MFERTHIRLGLLVTTLIALSGCARPSTPASVATGSSATLSAAQHKSRLLTLAVDFSGFPDIDPSNGASTEVYMFSNVYETLLRFNPPGSKTRFTPILATDWQSEDGGLRWIFHLRKGVKFHDGTPFNAAAVKFSVERTKAQNRQIAYIWNPVKEIAVVDEHTVQFVLSYAAPMDLIVSSGYFAWMISPQVAGRGSEWFNAGRDAGTGPYTLQSFRRGEPIILRRFDDYWGGWKDGQIDTVVIESVPDVATRQQKMEAHQTDWANNLPYENLGRFNESKGLKVARGASFRNLFVALNTRKPPLDDVRVRRALLHSFPYDDYIAKVFAGHAMRAKGPVPAGMPGHAADLKLYTFDLEKARMLLRDAGQEAGFELDLTGNSEFTLHKALVEIWQPELAKLGITLNVKLLPWDAQWASTKTDPTGAQDLFAATWIPTYVTPYDALFNLFHSEEKTAFNWSYYRNPAYDALIDNANRLHGADPSAAEAMFRNAQQVLVDEAVALIVCDIGAAYVVSSDIQGYVPNPAYDSVLFAYDVTR